MLLEFTVANFRSFREAVTLSLVADPRLSERDKAVDEKNCVPLPDAAVLRAAAVYGANASGKSNLVRAISLYRNLVLNSSREGQAGDILPAEPFRLDSASRGEPTEVEAVFLLGGRQIRYGFAAAKSGVVREWLFTKENGADEVLGFEREQGAYTAGPAWQQDVSLEAKTRAEALHLSVAAAFNHDFAKEILGWVRGKLRVVRGMDDNETLLETTRLLEDGAHREAILELVRGIDVDIDGLELAPLDFDVDGPKELRALLHASRDLLQSVHGKLPNRILTLHRDPDGGAAIPFELSDESAGTQKVVALAGPVVEALATGRVLVVDELDARLHTLLAMEIVRLFQSETTNPRGAQLVFASHDTNLLSRALLRRDQLWFVEKSRDTHASALYSLADVRLPEGKRVRNDARYEVEYLHGRYGAVPFFGNLAAMVGDALAAPEPEAP